MPQGAQLEADGAVRFRVWAPAHERVLLELQHLAAPLAMQPQADGWHEVTTRDAKAGSRYRFVLADGLHIPDPASRFQPDDVHGASEVIDPCAYEWQHSGWLGRPWHECVLYELHVGAFTAEGTFRATIERLDYLRELGVTALEIMPVADFSGTRNWGYDGVLLYAPDSTYGRPEDFKALIDAAHARGLMVLLDVVYNHFGPEGNYLPACAPPFFTDRHKTPWGNAVNYDAPGSVAVREFVIHNALYWIDEYALDGLRLDAVHAIADDSPRHLLHELAERVRASAPERHIHLLLENEENAAHLLGREAGRRVPLYTAQWNDDVHHVLHTAVTGENSGYYQDYHRDTEKLARAMAEGFAFQGEAMSFRGTARGEPSAHLPPTAFVAFLQNHDQIGNRAFGERINALAGLHAVRAAAALYLLSPQIPMLFMGEEWAASQPFPFFCDFHGELADAVRRGRREEFARFPEFQDPEQRARIPDPQAPATFAAAKLDWQAQTQEPHAQTLAWFRRILAIRQARLVPRLPEITGGGQYTVCAPGAIDVRWQARDGELILNANLSEHAVQLAALCGETWWQEGEVSAAGHFSPWSVRWSWQTAPLS